jgi:putative ABC transport system ATP-binding protein
MFPYILFKRKDSWSKSMAENIIIDLRGVNKTFDGPAGPIQALKSVSLKVYPGEFVGVRGPSGSGKSTLINMITGIDRPTRGDVHVTGAHLNDLNENQLARWRGRNVGVIFQFFQLLPTLTVMENIVFPMECCRVWKPRERPERAMHLLEQVGLADQAHKLPNTLSGGQQQRAAIARALANDPALIMGDEPTGNLDTKSADKVFYLFEELVKQGKTFMMVTHDLGLASRIPRVVEVLDGDLFDNGNGHK